MRTEYKRDMNHNYLIFHGEEVIDTDSYQVRMLIGNAIPSLLKCRVQVMDGKFLVCFDVTSRQTMISLYEQKKFLISDLKLIFGSFVTVMEEMSEYLMNPEHLCLDPEYMFLDAERKNVFFCYVPGISKDLKEQFRTLTEYILPKVDHEDGQAVMLGYGVYRRALEEVFQLEHIKEELYRTKELSMNGKIEKGFEEKPSSPFAESIETESTELFREEVEKEEKRPATLWKTLAIWGLLAIFLLALTALKFAGYLPWIEMEAFLAFVVGILVLSMTVSVFYKMIKQKGSQKANAKKKEESGEYERWKEEEMLFQEEPQIKEMSEASSEKKVVKAKELSKLSMERNFGETVVLSENATEGPATLVSREAGELATIYLQEELTIIGKLETAADVVIDLPTVSRVHAKIRMRDGEYYLTDLNSRNGTVVNGKILKEEYMLQNEDEVDFAQARYIFLK